jgi:hypothetical protein
MQIISSKAAAGWGYSGVKYGYEICKDTLGPLTLLDAPEQQERGQVLCPNRVK